MFILIHALNKRNSLLLLLFKHVLFNFSLIISVKIVKSSVLFLFHVSTMILARQLRLSFVYSLYCFSLGFKSAVSHIGYVLTAYFFYKFAGSTTKRDWFPFHSFPTT